MSADAMRDPTKTRSIAIVGASGFLGTALSAALTARGEKVRAIGRGESNDVRWDGVSAMPANALDGCEAVISLAGEPIAQRWTPRVRRAIKDSRVNVTRAVAEACASVVSTARPTVLLSGSAMGIYGDRGDEWLDESSALGNDYLAEVGRAWEGATAAASAAGLRVVHLRTGLPLHPSGGALRELLTPFKLGVGGPVGSGKQWMSWISREDWVRAVMFALDTATLRGPMNVSAPAPVRNEEFAETLGRALRRPAVLKAPAFALKLAFGEMAEATILASQRMRPRALETAGFAFTHPTLASALWFELGLV
jgi:uncharacterized protein (TIGR01777 family)